MTEPASRQGFHGCLGHEAVDSNGDSIGYVDLLFVDDATGEPELIGVWNGVWGTRPRVLVPLEGVEISGDKLVLPWSKNAVEDAPPYDEEDRSGALLQHEGSVHVSADKERAVFEHFGLTPPATAGQGRRMRRSAVEQAH
jgi:hypothetical protein